MLTINDLKPKLIVLLDGAPYQMLEVKHLHMGRGGSSVQTKIRNLGTGRVFLRNFKPADTFDQAEVEKRELTYLYTHRGEYVFASVENQSRRWTLTAEILGHAGQWLKPNQRVQALFFNGRLLGASPPIKVDLQVSDAPPGLRGDTATSPTKTVTLETGARLSVPLFVNEGDIVRVNTESGEYVERVAKRPGQ